MPTSTEDPYTIELSADEALLMHDVIEGTITAIDRDAKTVDVTLDEPYYPRNQNIHYGKLEKYDTYEHYESDPITEISGAKIIYNCQSSNLDPTSAFNVNDKVLIYAVNDEYYCVGFPDEIRRCGQILYIQLDTKCLIWDIEGEQPVSIDGVTWPADINNQAVKDYINNLQPAPVAGMIEYTQYAPPWDYATHKVYLFAHEASGGEPWYIKPDTPECWSPEIDGFSFRINCNETWSESTCYDPGVPCHHSMTSTDYLAREVIQYNFFNKHEMLIDLAYYMMHWSSTYDAEEYPCHTCQSTGRVSLFKRTGAGDTSPEEYSSWPDAEVSACCVNMVYESDQCTSQPCEDPSILYCYDSEKIRSISKSVVRPLDKDSNFFGIFYEPPQYSLTHSGYCSNLYCFIIIVGRFITGDVYGGMGNYMHQYGYNECIYNEDNFVNRVLVLKTDAPEEGDITDIDPYNYQEYSTLVPYIEDLIDAVREGLSPTDITYPQQLAITIYT